MFDRAELEARIPPTEAVKLVSNYLTFITQTNDKMIDQQKRKPTRFHAKQIPSIDILGYFQGRESERDPLTKIIDYF